MRLLTIAGFDPSGGAGVLLDAAVFRSFGFEASAVLTAATVQNSAAVFQIHPFSSRFIRSQFRALMREQTVSGLKIGMTGTAANLEEIGRLLAGHPKIPRVVDPIMHSSSGRRLDGAAGSRAFVRAFHENASVLTPNLDEAARLAGRPVRTLDEMRDAAEAVFDRTGVPCLVKGGHLKGPAVNLLYDGNRTVLIRRLRIRRDVHGTGCLFSAALLASLVRTGDLISAARTATDWTHRAIQRASLPGSGLGRAAFTPLSFPRS